LRNPKGLTVIPEERDAWAFLDAAAITSSRQQRAVIELVRGLKHAQLWTKMKAIYPFVGGTATTHKYNLKDPRDADAAFRLTFTGGWTHSTTGATPNGTNAYGDTFFVPSVETTKTDHHASVYSRTDSSGASIKCEIGALRNIGYFVYQVIYAKFSNLTFMVSGDNVFPNFSNTNSAGFFLLAKSAFTTLNGYYNSVKKLTSASTSTQPTGNIIDVKMYVGAANENGTAIYYSDRQLAFASLGSNLTDTDATNLYNIVQRFQTSLGRQV
jgi:hypothetical protein